MVNKGSAALGNSTVANNFSAGLHRNVPEKVFRPESPHSILNIESRPLLREGPIGRSADRDDNKYKRKTPQEIFSRWSRYEVVKSVHVVQFLIGFHCRQFYSPAARPPWRRTWFLVMVGMFLFLSVIYLMYHYGRAPSDDELAGVHYDE